MKVSEIQRIKRVLKAHTEVIHSIIGYAIDEEVTDIKLDNETQERLSDMAEDINEAYYIIETLFNKIEI